MGERQDFHAGGAAKGVTVVTHELNKPFYERVWARPRTIAPDLLSTSPRPAVFETAADKKVMTDGTKTIELYHMKGTSHNVANLLIYMPNEKLVFWGDGYSALGQRSARHCSHARADD